jgi:hypothetical protein
MPGNEVYVNTKGGGINPLLNNADNMRNGLVHEKGHFDDNNNGIENTLREHANIYLKQMQDKSFGASTIDFQKGIAGSFGQFLMNNIVESDGNPIGIASKMIATFNKTNTAGITMSADFTSGDGTGNSVSFKIKGSKSVSTVRYKKARRYKRLIMLKVCGSFFLLFFFIGCKQRSISNKLIDRQSTFWDVLSKDKSYIIGSYLFDRNGSCMFYTYKAGKRSKLYDGDVVYPHTWKIIGDTTLRMLGFDRYIIKITDDSLYLKNIQLGDTIILIKSR